MVGVVEFYKGQDIFVTGATGFLGKSIVEKILRFSPDVGNIYILMRPKKGKDIAERVQEMLQLPVYDVLRRDNPQSFSKIIPVAGDCMELGLGLADSDRSLIEDRVSIVFHVAATIRFDETLKKAILLNTRGTREMVTLARNMKKLKVFLHVSTAYCNCDRLEVEEKLYPPHADWKHMIQVAESYDVNFLSVLCPKIIDTLPNTYTFTKSLAEHVITDLGGNLPVVIFRPSIVLATHHEPIPGWVDNFNGPLGLVIPASYGLMRMGYGDPNLLADYIPLDSVVNLMIIAAWSKASSGNTTEQPVYNASSHNIKTFSTQEVMDVTRSYSAEAPPSNMIWVPSGAATTIWLWYYISILVVQVLPAVILDGLIKLSGNEPMLCRIQRKLYTVNAALVLFTHQKWTFLNDKCLALRSQVPAEDKEHFKHLYELESHDHYSYIRLACTGARKYLMKESEDTIPTARKRYFRMWWIDKFARVGIAILCVLLMSQLTWTCGFLSCFIALMIFT